MPTLYIVSTPIGNLSDFSLRAKDVLNSVSFILCEDTRHTLKLLSHFSIRKHLESLHAHNEKNKIEYLINKILQSETQTVALVSDAGTPAICDPGSYLVSAAHNANIEIISIPGPCSMISSVSACGFIQPRTLFSGFLPKNKQDQFEEFEKWLLISPCIAVFFESPKRVLESLLNFQEYLTQHNHSNQLQLCISREISKKFEEHKRFLLIEAIKCYQEKIEINGEFVICININKVTESNVKISAKEAAKEAFNLSMEKNLPLKIACKDIAKKYNLNSKEIYASALTEKN